MQIAWYRASCFESVFLTKLLKLIRDDAALGVMGSFVVAWLSMNTRVYAVSLHHPESRTFGLHSIRATLNHISPGTFRHCRVPWYAFDCNLTERNLTTTFWNNCDTESLSKHPANIPTTSCEQGLSSWKILISKSDSCPVL